MNTITKDFSTYIIFKDNSTAILAPTPNRRTHKKCSAFLENKGFVFIDYMAIDGTSEIWYK